MTDGRGAAVVHLPRSLVALFPGAERRMEARGATVLDVLRDLDDRVPGLANRVLDAGPSIRRHLNLFVNGDLASLETPVPPGAAVHVIPAVSGG
ncbi:MAG: MoaD/ThiS family protein [Candidatus Limnocylindrales bacterium]